MNNSDQINDLPSPTQHQQTTSSYYNELNKDETDITETVSQRRDGVRRNVNLESFPSTFNDNDEVIPHITNGGSSVADTTSSVPAFPFSVTRVWICATLIISIYIVGMMILGPLTSQYMVHYFTQGHDNLTTNSSRSRSTCTNSTSLDDDFINTAQKKSSRILLYSALVSSIPAFFTCIFAGSISDFVGRKALLIISLSGIIFKTVLLCLIIIFQLNVELLYIGSAVDGVVGSYFVAVVAVTAIISDITLDGKNKAVRFAILEGIILVFGALSQLAVGYLIEAAGFFVPALVCSCLLVVPLLVTIFLLPETLQQKRPFSWNVKMHLKKTFGFYFSKTKGRSLRLQFIFGLAAHFTLVFANIGKSSIETLFVLNKPICWNSVAIGIFGAVRMVVMSLAAVIALKVCKHRLSLEMTGVICGISSTAGFILEGLADSTWMMYLSSVVGLLFTASLPLPRALLSQIAPPGEQGALFSSMSCTEALAGLAASAIYILIYNATIDTFKGAAFMAVAGMCLLNVISLGMFRLLKVSPEKDYEHMIEDPINEKTDSHNTGHESETYGSLTYGRKTHVRSSPILA